MDETARIFEDLHALAHHWMRFCSQDAHEDFVAGDFETFLKQRESNRWERMMGIFLFTKRIKGDLEDGYQERLHILQ